MTPAQRVWEAMCALVLDHDRRDEVCAALGMSFFRIKVLRRVAAEPATMRALVEGLGSDAPYVSVVVEDLARRGLVERTPDPRDRRRKIVSVTAEGAVAAAHADELMRTPPPALLVLPAAELEVLDRVLVGLAADA